MTGNQGSRGIDEIQSAKSDTVDWKEVGLHLGNSENTMSANGQPKRGPILTLNSNTCN
jgi:hypothetical protein